MGGRVGGGWEQACIRTAVHRRRRGATPPWTPPPLPFQCLELTANFSLRCLRCQEHLHFKVSFGRDHRGTLGGRGSQPTPPPPPFQTPPPLQTPV